MKADFYDYHNNEKLITIHDNHEETVIYHEEEGVNMHMVEIVNRAGTFRGFGETEAKAREKAINNYVDRVGKSEGMSA